MLKLPQEAKQIAWNYLNDSQRLVVGLQVVFGVIPFCSVISLIYISSALCTQNGCRVAIQVRGIDDVFSATQLPIHTLAYTLKVPDHQAAAFCTFSHSK